MTTESIVIEVADKVSTSISNKMQKIAADARTADSAVEKLKTTLAALAGSSVAKLQAEMSRLSGELQRMTTVQNQLSAAQAQAATAAQRLATEQQRTATATANAAAAQTRALTATTQGATASQRLATAQQQTAAASDRAAAAHLRLQQAQAQAARAAEQLDTATRGVLMRLGALVGTVISAQAIVKAADEYQGLSNKLQIVSDSSEQAAELQARLFDVADRTRSVVGATTQAFARFDNALVASGKSQEETLRLTETINKLFVIGGASASEQAGAMLQLSQAFNSGTLQGEEFRSVSENMPKKVRTAIAEVLKINESALKQAASDGKITVEVLFQAFKKLDQFADAKFAKTITTTSQAMVVLSNNFIAASGEIDKNLGITKTLVEFLGGLGNIILQVGDAFGAFGKEQDNVSAGSAIMKALLDTVLVTLQTVIVVGSDVAFVFKMTGIEIGAMAAQLAALARLDFDGFSAISDAVKSDAAAARKELDDFQARIMAVNTNPVTKKTETGAASLLRGSGPNTIKPTVSDKSLKAAESRAAALGKVNAQLSNELNRMELLKPAREAQAKFDQIEEQMIGKKIKLTAGEISTIKEKIAAIQQGSIVQAEFDRIYEDAVAPLRNYNAAVEATGKLLKSGAISQEQAQQAVGKASEAYLNSVDPLREFNKELSEQFDLLKMLPKQRDIEQQIMQKNNDMIQQRGLPLTQQETEALREKLTVLQQLNLATQAQDSLLAESVGRREEFANRSKAISELSKNPNSGFTSGDASQAGSDMLSGMGVDTSNLEIGLNAQAELYRNYYSQLQGMLDNQLISETDFAKARAQIAANESAAKLKTTSDFFGNLSALQNSNVKELAAIGKAAAITQAMMNTYEGATKALAQGGYYGAAMAAVVVANGLAQVANIRSQGNGFREGGYTGNIGVNEVAGEVHGREFVMDANSTARLGVGNLEALRSGAASVQKNGKQAGVAAPSSTSNAGNNVGNQTALQRPQLNARIINVMDKNMVGDYLDTYDGEESVLNVIRNNKDAIQRIVRE